MSTDNKKRVPLHIHCRLPGPLVSLPPQRLESNTACMSPLLSLFESPKPWVCFVSLFFFLFHLERRLYTESVACPTIASLKVFFFQTRNPLWISECSWYTHISHCTLCSHPQVEAASSSARQGFRCPHDTISSNLCSFLFLPKS